MNTSDTATAPRKHRRRRSAASRHAQSARMKAVWEKRRAGVAESGKASPGEKKSVSPADLMLAKRDELVEKKKALKRKSRIELAKIDRDLRGLGKLIRATQRLLGK